MHFTEIDITKGDSCAQVITNGKGFSHFYPVMGKGNAWQSLSCFINEYGVLEHLVVDGAKEQGAKGTHKPNWMKLINRYNIRQTLTQPYCW